jgi:two-component system KDP operon response regulator KdpE
MTRVLVVDDDRVLARALAINFGARSYEVDVALTGADALAKALHESPDVVVLDLGLPDMDGIDVLHDLRRVTSAPVLVLSARAEQSEKVAALDAGADDYVTKPFGMEELLARLRAAVRRVTPVADDLPVVETPHFTVDVAARRVVTGSGEVRLTPTEWHLLEVLVRSPGRLVPQRSLLREVWGPAYEKETHYLRVYLAQLRRKLEPDPSHPVHLITEPGMGYRFDP